MIDITSFNKSLKAVWVKKYLDNENCGHWKLLFDAELKKYGGKAIFRGNLNKTDTSNLIRVSDPFVKELLAIWSEVVFEDKVTTKEQFISSPLWYRVHRLTESSPSPSQIRVRVKLTESSVSGL